MAKKASLFITTLLIAGCSGSSGTTSSPSAAFDAAKPSGVIGAVSSAAGKAGAGLGSSGVSASAISQDCDSHAAPLRNGVAIPQSDPDYPAKFVYCKMAYNTGDPDSVQGSFQMVQSISCMIERAGVTWDGQARTVTATPDLNCFTQAQLTNMGNPGSMSITVTASTPAAFNTYFDRGVVMGVPSFGTFTIGSKVTSTSVEFIAREDQTASNANKTGIYAAALDFTAGTLRYEARHDRFNDTTDSNGSGGWSRHHRIYATLETSGNSVTGVKTVSAMTADVNNGAVTGMSWGGQISTLTGSVATGLKARFWSASNGSGGSPASTNDFSNPSKWVETTNTRCYNSSGPTSGTCTSGLAIPTTNAANSFPFVQLGTGYTSTSSWLTSYGAKTYTSVDPSADTQ